MLLLGHLPRDATLVAPETILDSADRGYLGLVARAVSFGDLDGPDEVLGGGRGLNNRILGQGEGFEFFSVHGASRLLV